MGLFSRWRKKAVNIDQALTQALAELKQAAGEDLVSVLLYGSAVGQDSAEAKDVNLLVVTRRLDAATLNKLTAVTQGWAKQGVIKPMFFGAKELKASADVFPVEFLDIQDSHKVLHGDDPFRRMNVDKRNLRHQLEYEIKSKLITFRQRYLAGEGGKMLGTLIGELLASLLPDFRALLRLKRNRPARQRVRVLEDTARFYRLNRRVFLKAHDLHWRGKSLKDGELAELFENLLGELEKLGTAIDQMDSGEGRESRESRESSDDSRHSRGGRDRGRDRDRSSRSSVPPPRKDLVNAVRNLINEIPNRKKWEPKEAERFQSDDQARDAGQPVELRFGWDKDWLRYKAGKASAPIQVQAEAEAAAKAQAEARADIDDDDGDDQEERSVDAAELTAAKAAAVAEEAARRAAAAERAASEEDQADQTDQAEEDASAEGEEPQGGGESDADSASEETPQAGEAPATLGKLDEKTRTITQLSRSVPPRPRRDAAPEGGNGQQKAAERAQEPKDKNKDKDKDDSFQRLPEEKFNW